MESTLADEAVIARSIGHPESFRLVFERHHELVHNFARRRVGAALADDLAAEVFARAFSARAGYRPLTADARAWLLGIASKLIAGHRRAEARALRALQRSAPTARSDADDAWAGAELSASLAAALRRLSRRDREALLLLAWGELSYEEIAFALDVPIGTVRSRIHHARRQMEKFLSMHDRTPGEAHARPA